MKIEILGPAQFKTQAWKNGGGSTLELYKYPEHETYEFRLSIATVSASGPFSKFPGYLRTIIQLEGAPMYLRHPETNHTKTLVRHSPYFFDGDALTDCVVTNTARDFNIIYKKNMSLNTRVIELASGEDRILQGEIAKTFVYCVRGSIMVASKDTTLSLVNENQLCILTRGEASKEVVITAGKDGATLITVLKS